MQGKLSAAARAEIEAVLGPGDRALVDLGERKILIQVVHNDEDFDLDAFLSARPGAAEELRQAIAQADSGQTIDHAEVKRRFARPAP